MAATALQPKADIVGFEMQVGYVPVADMVHLVSSEILTFVFYFFFFSLPMIAVRFLATVSGLPGNFLS